MLVLSFLILLGLLGSSFNAQVQFDIRSTAWLAEQTRLNAAAQAGVIHGLIQATHPNTTQRWPLDNRPHPFHWQGQSLMIRLQNERGRIDMNLAPRKVFVGLIQHVLPYAASEQLADALIDWRDTDDRTPQQGSEIAAYQDAGHPYQPANRPYIAVTELANVLGFDQNMVTKLHPYLTVHARRSRIDASSADVAVIAALPGIDISQANQFIAHRERALNHNQTIDFSLLSPAQQFIETQATSHVFRIQIQITQQPEYRIEAVIRSTQTTGYQILHWEILDKGT